MNAFMRGLWMAVALTGLTALLTSSAHAAAGIPYQGHLTDQAGNPINGTRPLKLTLYNGANTVLYAENDTVTVTNGNFSVQLGTGTVVTGTFNPAVFAGFDVFLGIKVGADAEMTPKVHLGYSPFSMTSQTSPGIATGHVINGVNLTKAGATTDIVSATITVPTAGYVWVYASGQFNQSGVATPSFWISNASGSAIDFSHYGICGTGLVNGSNYVLASQQRVFAVSAGASTYYWEASYTGTDSPYVWNPTITAIFIPAAMGTVNLGAESAAGPVPPQQQPGR